jgi:hypothetical protein
MVGVCDFVLKAYVMKWIGGNMKRGRNRKRNNTGQG